MPSLSRWDCIYSIFSSGMKNKSTTDLRLVNILLIFGMTVALLVSMSSSQMMSASVEGGSPGPNNSNSNQGGSQASVPPNNEDVSCEEDPMFRSEERRVGTE